jgi:adenosylcobinamide kinase / adenosylcobinamide-phosphate guanylyltransferase
METTPWDVATMFSQYLLPTHRLILVTGAARSGKSAWAEQLARAFTGPVIYVATAQVDPQDQEWSDRLARHRQRRPAHWQLIESPVDVAAIVDRAQAGECLLIDSLGTWVANFLEDDQTTWQTASDRLCQALKTTPAQVIVVAEETGWGVVPAYPLGRTFRDRLGTITQQIGAIANPVYLVVAGRVVDLAQIGFPLITP